MNATLVRAVGLAAAVLPLGPLSSPCVAQPLPCPPEQIQRLMPSCERVGTFGGSVSLVDDVLAVGAGDALGGRLEFYSFDESTRQWVLDVEIPHPDPQQYDAFPRAIELHHDAATDTWLLAVGLPGRDVAESSDGMAYVFRREGSGQWMLEATLYPSDPVESGAFGSRFVWVTAGERTFLAIAAPSFDGAHIVGTVDIFEREAGPGWSHQARIESPGGPQVDGNFGFGLGGAEGEGGTVLLIGEPALPSQYAASGEVYCFRFDPARDEWIFEQQIEAPDPFDYDRFGFAVSVGSVHGEPGLTHRALVGRPSESVNSNWGEGAAYVYSRAIDGVWTLEDRIPNPTPGGATAGEFGSHVRMQSDGAEEAIVSASADSRLGRYSGAAFRLRRDPKLETWSVIQGLAGREQAKDNGFGSAIALGEGATAGTAVVGALGTQCLEWSRPRTVGAVYSFDLDPGDGNECPPPVLGVVVEPDCSTRPRSELEVRWFQATPDRSARIAILYARQTGNFAIPNGNPCAGLPLGLGSQGLQVAHIGSAGPFGAGRLRTNIPRAACGGYLQLLDINRCKLSNVVRIE